MHVESLVRKLGSLIEGQSAEGEGRRDQPVVNPATEEVVAVVSLANVDDMDRAITASVRGFEAWKTRSALERGRTMAAVAAAIRAETEHLATLLTTEQGKTLAEARGEVGATADAFEWLGEEGKRVYGRIVAARVPGLEQKVQLEPVGPVAAFSPWNYPLALAARKVAQALAAGCSIILKPAEEAPGAVERMVRICHACGVPASTVQLLFGVPAEISARLIASSAIRKVSFTGSIAVGKLLGAMAGAHLKKVTFELGGHSPVIVMPDADLKPVVQASLANKFRNAGQVCIAPGRFFLHEDIHDAFLDAFVAGAQALKVGNGMDIETQMGPLIDERRLPVMQGFVDDVLRRGGRLACGGARLKGRGWLWSPTILADVPLDARIMCEEPFGPVAPFTRFRDLGDAIAAANGVEYGLAGYAFTACRHGIRRIREELQVGMLGINTYSVSAPEMPFTGIKDSGLGQAMGREGLAEHLNIKSIFEMD